MTDGDQPEQLQSEAGQQDGKLPELTTCAKCGARLSEILPSCPTCGEGAARERRETAASFPSTMTVGSSSVFTVRYMILQLLAETNEPTYAKTIAQKLAPYGVKKDRVLKELNKLGDSSYKLVNRRKAGYPFSGKLLYSITENGVKELEKRKGIAVNRKEQMIDSPPIDPYLWLLENLIEPKTIDNLKKLRGDSEATLCAYLSNLFKLGVIDKYKQPESKQFSQRNKLGQIITRTSTVMKTYYHLRPGPLREKMAQGTEFSAIGKPAQTFKVEVPIGTGSAKEPVFSAEEDEKYQKWREDTREMEEFHKQILKRANKAGMRPIIAYRLVFKQLLDNGKL